MRHFAFDVEGGLLEVESFESNGDTCIWLCHATDGKRYDIKSNALFCLCDDELTEVSYPDPESYIMVSYCK